MKLQDFSNELRKDPAFVIAELQLKLEEATRRNTLFTACLHRAQKLFLEKHPDYPGFPDGAVNIAWLLEAFDKERKETAELTERTRRIPVGERLPENSDKVLVWMEYPDLFIAPKYDFGYYINGEWIGDNTDSMVHSKNVTHWMPLPPPPEVTND